MIGALHATGMDFGIGPNFAKRKRITDLTGASQSTAENALESAHAHSEFVERKRTLPFSARLHPAKYLAMDKMLKQLFFPTMTTKLNFGISSITGFNLKNVEDAITDGGPGTAASTIQEAMRPRGLCRGVAQFIVRNTDFDTNRDSQNGLNPSQFPVGGYTTTPSSGIAQSYDIESSYRKFSSNPTNTTDSGAGANDPPALVESDQVATNTIRSLSLGSNLHDIEQNAVAGMIYADPVVSQQRFSAAAGVISNPSANTGLIGGETGVVGTNILGPSSGRYWSYMKDGVIRIMDGYVHLDVMNTEQTPCVVEVVIHSRKKTDLATQAIYNMLFEDVQRSQKQKAVTDPASSTGIGAGGWQAWYDPKYPLLKFNSNARVKEHITEVHRSNHVLAPGQSKVIKIALGNLWYKIGNKSDSPYVGSSGTTPSSIEKLKRNAGQLMFNIGHSGFEYPQNIAMLPFIDRAFTLPATDTTQNNPYGNKAGTSFWVGKAHAPSSISIDGTYCDKFYPCTFDRSPNGVLNHDILKVANVDNAAVPLATIVPNRTAASQSDIVQSIAA